MSVSAPLPHDAATLHVGGAATYVDDIPPLPGTLRLAFGLSSIAKGRIASMDLSAVRAAEGVAAVLTAADLPGDNDVSPSAHDEPLLSDGSVHYVGQPIFLVAAETHLLARKAARLGKVSYHAESPVLSIDDALAAGSEFVDGPVIWEKGDAAAAIAAAEHVVEGRIEIGGQEHFYLEGQAALALPREGGDMVVHSSSQHPSEIQDKVAGALGVPMHAVRVEVRRMGGGFGGKESQGNAPACACAVAARITGRPCAMRYDREDDMVVTGKRHDFRVLYRAGFSGDGRISGVEFTHYCRCGWSLDLSTPVADRAMLHADSSYHLPAARIESHRLKTNTQSATAFRGFGGPQGMLGMERVMDHAAHVLGADPFELRRRNFYADATDRVGSAPVTHRGVPGGAASPGGTEKPGATAEPVSGTAAHPAEAGTGEATPRRPADVQTTPYGMAVEDFILGGLTERLAARHAERRAAVDEWNAGNDILKRGLALTPVKFGISFTLTHLNQAGALVHVYRDGSIHLNHGGTEMGQGLFQKVAQVAATAFGVDIGAVKITATDTSKVPNTSATAASAGSDLNGMAVKAACDTIRGRMAERLAESRRVAAGDVLFENGRVHVGGEIIGFADAAKFAHESRVPLSATGFYRTPKLDWDRNRGSGRPFFYFAYGAALTEAVVDTLTGENRILSTWIVHDCGDSLNPAVDRGQIEGGFAQGVGWLTTEELAWDGAGTLLTRAPSTYKIPACSDRPEVFEVEFWDGRNREETIHRSKAVGEPPLMLGISAFLALSDAARAAGGGGYPALDAPATPERILAAVERARG